MIPALAVMIGLYILVRMVELFVVHAGQDTAHPALFLVAGLTALVAAGGMAYIVIAAHEAQQALDAIPALPF